MQIFFAWMMLMQFTMAADDGGFVAAPQVVHQETDTGRCN
jgi:hypothetical protein